MFNPFDGRSATWPTEARTSNSLPRNFDNVFAAIILIGLIGLVCDLLFAQLGRRLFPWQRDPASGVRA